MIKRKIVFFTTVLLIVACLVAVGEGEGLSREAKTPTSFSVIVLPDTQGYSEANPGIFYSQTEWIVENRKGLNVKLVVHLGDVVEHPESNEEWRRAKKAMDPLGREGIPTLITFGNHDYTDLEGGRADNPFNKYFPVSRYSDYNSYGGTYSKDSRTTCL